MNGPVLIGVEEEFLLVLDRLGDRSRLSDLMARTLTGGTGAARQRDALARGGLGAVLALAAGSGGGQRVGW